MARVTFVMIQPQTARLRVRPYISRVTLGHQTERAGRLKRVTRKRSAIAEPTQPRCILRRQTIHKLVSCVACLCAIHSPGDCTYHPNVQDIGWVCWQASHLLGRGRFQLALTQRSHIVRFRRSRHVSSSRDLKLAVCTCSLQCVPQLISFT